MQKFLLALLTTLFVSAMPLQAAYALADDANLKEACSLLYKDALPPESIEKLKAQNGTVVLLEGPQAQAFQSRVERLVGQPAPWKTNRILLVNPNGEADAMVNIAFFVDDCISALLHFPQTVVDTLLSPLEKKPGERVD